MLLDIFVYVALFGGVGLAIYSVYKRIKSTGETTAGYVYNGKTWVTWLFVITVLAILFSPLSCLCPLSVNTDHTVRNGVAWACCFMQYCFTFAILSLLLSQLLLKKSKRAKRLETP